MWVFESAEIYENVGVVFQDTMAYLHTIKRLPGRIFIKFERDEGSVKLSLLCAFYQDFCIIPVI